MTVLDVIQKSSEFLARKGIAPARLQSELLLAHVLKIPRMNLYLNFDRKLTEPELALLRQLVKRRAQHEPLQYIIGTACFCGLELVVDRHVLVPRPETELLAEKGWQFLGTRPLGAAALDYGTGSGCIAIALATRCPHATIWAVDCSAKALEVARLNAARHNVTDRLRFVHGDGFTALSEPVMFDLIIGNPPYIPTDNIRMLQPEVRDFEPRQALDGGPDGLDSFRRVAAKAGAFLKTDGLIMLEFGQNQLDQLRAIFTQHDWVVVQVEQDYNQQARILIARRGR